MWNCIGAEESTCHKSGMHFLAFFQTLQHHMGVGLYLSFLEEGQCTVYHILAIVWCRLQHFGSVPFSALGQWSSFSLSTAPWSLCKQPTTTQIFHFGKFFLQHSAYLCVIHIFSNIDGPPSKTCLQEHCLILWGFVSVLRLQAELQLHKLYSWYAWSIRWLSFSFLASRIQRWEASLHLLLHCGWSCRSAAGRNSSSRLSSGVLMWWRSFPFTLYAV